MAKRLYQQEPTPERAGKLWRTLKALLPNYDYPDRTLAGPPSVASEAGYCQWTAGRHRACQPTMYPIWERWTITHVPLMARHAAPLVGLDESTPWQVVTDQCQDILADITTAPELRRICEVWAWLVAQYLTQS